MKYWLILPALFLYSIAASAQSHSVGVGFQDPITGATYKLYRAPCTGTVASGVCSAEGAFVVVTTTALNASAASDTTVAAGQSYSYYVTTFCATGGSCPSGTQGESVPSNHVGAAVPFNTPPPPTNLTITSVAFGAPFTDPKTGQQVETATAKWSNTAVAGQHFAFSDGHNFISQGLIGPTSGTFAQQVTVPVGTTVIFSVDDATGTTATQRAM